MNLILNIGLAVKDGLPIGADAALLAVAANDFRVVKHLVAQSDTEPTLVVEVLVLDLPALAWRKLHQVANDLRQECIAAYNAETDKGALIGPQAAAWGDFNPEFFITPDGQRLAQPVKVAA